jgi:protein ImuB
VVPEYRAARFAALLAARLEATVVAAPVRRMEFSTGRLRRFVARSAGLWAPGEQGGGAAQRAPEFLQTLLARLGERAVHGLACVDEHRPERQQRSVWPSLALEGARAAPLLPGPAAADGEPAAGRGGAARPLGLLAEPQPLEALRDEAGQVRRLLHAGRDLTLVSGPERLETGWWDGGDVARDYYVASSSDGGRWWIFRECAAARRWFVHGCFA